MATAQPNSSRNRRREPEEADEGFQAQAEQWSRRLGESAQHVWWAGLGALQRAQAEGSRLFDTLVQEGAEVDRDGRRRAGERTDSMREEVEAKFDQARDTAASGWSRLERAFDERLRSALRRLDVPERDEVDLLRKQVQTLRSQVTKLQANQRAAQAMAEAQVQAEAQANPLDDEGEPGPTVPAGP